MKSVSMAALLIAVLSGSAQAADLGSLKDTPVEIVAPFSWTGFYIGGHLGGAWGDIDQTRTGGTQHYYTLNKTIGTSSDGLWGGGHLGAQYQSGQFVFGAEVSWSDGHLDDTVRTTGPFALNTYDTEISDMFTATGRLGYAVDRWLGYVKGGYASADISTRSSEVPSFNHTGTSSERHDGWTIGGGLEYALTNSMVVGVEYNYVDLNSDVHGLTDNAPQGATPEPVNVDPQGVSSLVGRFSLKF